MSTNVHSPLRKEDARLLRGRANFVDNIHRDRMVHGVFLRSPFAHARIVSIDASEAMAAGALAVFTAADLPFNDKSWITRYWHPDIRGGMPKLLADDRVRYVGEPVAFLVASDRYVGEDLLALVNVEYDALPVVSTVDTAVAAGAPQLHESWTGNVAAAFEHARGDAAAALEVAPHRVQRKYKFPRQIPMPLETRGIVAEYDEERASLSAWMSTQAHYHVRQNLAHLLELPEYQVRVIAEDVGGGFGAKSRFYPEEVIVSYASRMLCRPVKWIEDRLENFQATTHSRAIDIDLEIACDSEGRFTALKALVILDIGGYTFTSGIVTAEVASAIVTNAYRFPNFEIKVRCVGTNKTPIATYRGAGAPEGVFPIESLIDILAKQIELTAHELRRRNLVLPSDFPYDSGTSVGGMKAIFESGDYPELMQAAVDESGYTEKVEVSADGERTAWGMACAMEYSGIVNFETALIRMDTAGRLTIHSGMTSQGQGQLTTYAMICAETLDMDLDCITVRMGDTQLMAAGRGAFASRGAIFGGNAVLGAAQALRVKILDGAARLLNCDAALLTVTKGIVHRTDGDPASIPVGHIARAILPGGALFTGTEIAMEAQYVYWADQPMTCGMSMHIARVKLNPRTGFFQILDYLVAHDAGRELNPMIVRGQIVGGVVDGIGGALFSEIEYDENGQLLTGSLADYAVATAPDVPRIGLIHRETRPTTNPLGVRGIGEGGLIATGAVLVNALARAIDARGTGHEKPLLALPLRPERVFNACRIAGLDVSGPAGTPR